MINLKNKRSRPPLPLVALAIVGIIGSTLQLIQPMSNGSGNGGFFEILNFNPRRLTTLVNAPYAPYRGEIEPAESRRKLSAWKRYNNGTITCHTRSIRGPEAIPADVDFKNTIVVGYPGADKRVVLRQMEVMTRLSGRDAWDFEFLGMTRQPYIKTNYPHHEGIWGKPLFLIEA